MIIRLFKNSSSAVGAVNYVLSDRDYTGKTRSVKPVVLNGSAELTKLIDATQCAKFSHKSVSGVISFADNEEITDKQKFELIEDFKKSFFGNCKDKANALFVEHRDKGNLEIHFVINRAVMTEQGIRAFNPFPPGKMTIDFKDCFCALKNDEYKFKQITENPLKTKFSNDEKKARRLDKNSFINLEDKEKLDLAIKDIVKNGFAKNKNELVEYLKNEIGLNVHRNGDDYISIKTESGKNIRLKGGIYSNHDNNSYDDVKKAFTEEKQKPFDREKTLSTFNRILEARNKYNSSRYEVKATSKAPRFERTQSQGQASKASSAVAEQQHSQGKKNTLKTSPGASQEQQSRAGQDSTSEDKPRALSSAGFGGGSGAISAQMSVDKALADLSNAKTYAEVAKAKAQLAIATANLNRVLQSIEEDRKRSLNKIKI